MDRPLDPILKTLAELSPPDWLRFAGRRRRRVTVEDNLLIARLEKNRLEAYNACTDRLAERGIPAAVIADLIQRGHQVKSVLGNGGGYQAIMIDPRSGMLHGGSEYRKDGCAVGY